MKTFQDVIEDVNRNIREIKEFGLQPVTLKAPANIIEKFIEPKGTSSEGEFKTYDQYVEEYGYITEEEYETYVASFIVEYTDQLTLEGAIKWQAEAILDRLEGNIDEYYYDQLANLDRADLVEIIQKAGMATNEAVRNGFESSIFYHYLIQYMSDYDTSDYT